MKTLVVLAINTDSQALIWYNLCKRSNIPAVFINIIDFSVTWDLEVNNKEVYINYNGTIFYFHDKEICWYVRTREVNDLRVQNIISIVFDFLSVFSYGHGNFFFKDLDFLSIESSKLIQLSKLSKIKNPVTNIQTIFDSTEKNQNLIVKSISYIRSIVVDFSDIRLRAHNAHACYSICIKQNKINGVPLKVHCYKKRSGSWIFFSVLTPSDEIDYRYDDSTAFKEIFTSRICIEHAEIIFNNFGVKFFDIDYIYDKAHNDFYFLEVNFGPVPTYYEKSLERKIYFYSSKILKDWLL